MDASGRQHLPPLPELLEQIEFPVYGLATSYLRLQLRSLHYGVDEETKHLVGLGLFYAQKYLGSPQVLAVESSRLPPKVLQEDPAAHVEWSWSNLVSMRELLFRLHTNKPAELLDEEVHDRQFQEAIEALREYPWTRLTQKSSITLLQNMDVSRGPQGDILARRFDGPNMLLVISMGLEPENFVAAIRQLVPLQQAPKAVLRHQEEFERITAV